jgi:carboxylesterase
MPDPTENTPKTVRDKALRTALPVVLVIVVGVVLTALLLSWAWALGLWLGAIVLVVAVTMLYPVRTAALVPHPEPCPSFDAAVERFDAGPRAREAQGMHPKGVSLLWHHGRRTPNAAVLLHGLSNSPHSMIQLGAALHDRGWNVMVPRLPRHGHADLATDALKRLTAEELRDSADEAVDIAVGLGETVTVLGISGGGVIAAWIGQLRGDVSRAILIAPAFGLGNFGGPLNSFLSRLMLLIPSISIWKDPALKADFPGLGHNYKRIETRGVGQVSRLGLAAVRAARHGAPAVATAAVVTNPNDKAVDPGMAVSIAETWGRHIPVDRYVFPDSPVLGHEIIDPADPEGDVSVTYPVLLRLLGAGEDPPVGGGTPAFGSPA